jgi:hypothetical protein
MLGGCTSQASDSPADAGAPTSLGSGERIRQVMAPGATNNGATVAVTGATYLLVDSYDETHDGKSIGTIYMQDVPPSGSPPPPYSGVALYKPTFIPTSLVPAPGDVLDFTGVYSASKSLGAATFDPGTSLIQIDDPILQPRFEYQLPPPLVITAAELDEGATFSQAQYNTAQQYVGMLVTIQNVTLADSMATDSAGRSTVHIMSDISQNGPTLDNELFDLASWNKSFPTPPLQTGTQIQSVTGIVTWFFNYHIAPRSPADIVLANGNASDGGQ